MIGGYRRLANILPPVQLPSSMLRWTASNASSTSSSCCTICSSILQACRLLLHPKCNSLCSLARISSRNASNTSSGLIMNVFDRNTKVQQRDRVLLQKDYRDFLYLKDEVGYRVFDRLCDVKRTFGTCIDLGCGLGHVTKHITAEQQLVTDKIYMVEPSKRLIESAETSADVPCERLNIDEEMLALSGINSSSIDLVYSSLSLHWINDLPGLFKQVLQLLKNDGVFIGSMFGTDTVYELRVALQLAEQEILGGFHPHISPFTTVRDLGDLMNRAGFTLITLDADEIVVNYPGIWELIRDLKGMGESSCSWKRPLTLRRDVIKRAEEIYRERYGNEDGSIPASYCILSFIGWKPDPSQPKPAERGSANVSLKDIASYMENLDNPSKS